MNAIVSEKGQLTIPKPLRDRLGITKGTVVDVTEVRGTLIITRHETRDPVDRFYGMLKDKIPDVDQYVAEVRGSKGP